MVIPDQVREDMEKLGRELEREIGFKIDSVEREIIELIQRIQPANGSTK